MSKQLASAYDFPLPAIGPADRRAGVTLARRDKPENVPARALILTPPAAPGAEYNVGTTLLMVFPDGTSALGRPSWRHSWYYEVIRLGHWVPVLVPPGQPDEAELDEDHVPSPEAIAAAIGEAPGGPAVAPAAPDEWRVKLALDYAERLIAEGPFSPEQADAIRRRISAGV